MSGGVEHTSEQNPISPQHYARLTPQPIEVIEAWGLPWSLGNVVKYVARYDAKGGLEDLRKAAWYLDHYIQRNTLAVPESRQP